MTFGESVDALDLVISCLKEHEVNLDRLVGRMELLIENFEATVDEESEKKSKQTLMRILDKLEEE